MSASCSKTFADSASAMATRAVFALFLPGLPGPLPAAGSETAAKVVDLPSCTLPVFLELFLLDFRLPR